MTETYYDLLGIETGAAPPEVKAAYRRQALKWHPDKNNGSRESEQRFKRIAEAYAVLSDPAARRAYDAVLEEGSDPETLYSTKIDPETAAAIFLQEMLNLASELTLLNVSWRDIARELGNRGCSEAVAQQIAFGVEQGRKSAVRAAAGRAMLWALFWLGLGALITAGTYTTAARQGRRYYVTAGLFVFGGWNLLRALYYLATGEVPKPKY